MSNYASQTRQPYPSEQPFARAGAPVAAYRGSDYEGKRSAQLSMAFGVLSLFMLWFVFGPLAISHANKAEKMGEPSVGGKILGWVAIGLGALSILFVIAFFTMFAAAFQTALQTGSNL